MKNLLFLFISSVLLLSCSNNKEEDQKEELYEVEETFVENTDRVEKDSVIIPEKLRKSRYFEENELKELKERIKEKFDQLLFYSIYDNHYYYYVVKGKYNGIENEGKTFTIGILDSSFNEIIPVEYDKIYNIGTIREGTVIVEKDGLRGLYNLSGEELIKTQYHALYPSNEKNVLAQFKKENAFGWIDFDGREHRGNTLSPHYELGKSPLESQLIKNWQFSNKTMNLLIDAKYFPPSGYIITPSFIYDLGFLPAQLPPLTVVENGDANLDNASFKVKATKFFGEDVLAVIVGFFESGPDARDYFVDDQTKLVLLNSDMQPISNVTLQIRSIINFMVIH